MFDYKSEEFRKFKLANLYHYNIWEEDIEKTPMLSTREFNKYIENDECVDEDMLEDGMARPTILIKYKNNLTKLIKLLENEFNIKHSKGGRKPKLTIEDKLRATVDYLSTNKTFFEIAKEYDIHESNMYESILWVIDTLSRHKIIDSEKDENGRIIAIVDCKRLYFLDIKKKM